MKALASFIALVIALPMSGATAVEDCRAGTAQVAVEATPAERYLNLLRLIVNDHRALSSDVLDHLADSETRKIPSNSIMVRSCRRRRSFTSARSKP